MAYGVGIGGGSTPMPGADRTPGFNVSALHAYVVPTNPTDPRTAMCGATDIGLYVDNWAFHHYVTSNDPHWGELGPQVCGTCNSHVNS